MHVAVARRGFRRNRRDLPGDKAGEQRPLLKAMTDGTDTIHVEGPVQLPYNGKAFPVTVMVFEFGSAPD